MNVLEWGFNRGYNEIAQTAKKNDGILNASRPAQVGRLYSLEVKALERMENARRTGGGGLFGYAQTTALVNRR